MWSSKTTDAIEARGKQDLNSITGSLFKSGPYVPLMPKGKGLLDPRAIEKTMVQGGTFVFDGQDEIFSHYDASSGVHADLDEASAYAQLVEYQRIPRMPPRSRHLHRVFLAWTPLTP